MVARVNGSNGSSDTGTGVGAGAIDGDGDDEAEERVRRDGGKVTLRLISAGDGARYGGELSAGTEAGQVEIAVSAAGNVTVTQVAGISPPEWLVAFARATLRTAWRATQAGTPWPRRLSRWRPSSEEQDSGP
jgi:hypothetical protein